MFESSKKRKKSSIHMHGNFFKKRKHLIINLFYVTKGGKATFKKNFENHITVAHLADGIKFSTLHEKLKFR